LIILKFPSGKGHCPIVWGTYGKIWGIIMLFYTNTYVGDTETRGQNIRDGVVFLVRVCPFLNITITGMVLS
jgi:hypothetical protein